MNKSDYIQLRNENRLHEIAFNHYKEKGGTYDFQTCLKSGVFNFLNMEALVEELDKHFGVTLVIYNEKLLKVQ